MKKINLVLLLLCLGVSLAGNSRDYHFCYIFQNSGAAGFPDLAGKLPPLKVSGKWKAGKNTIVLDGKTGRLTIKGSEKLSLKNKTLLALVKFYDSGARAGTLESSDALFFRAKDLLTGRDRWQGFYCNYREVRSSAPRITPGKFMLMAVNITETKEKLLKIELFINGKRINWHKPGKGRLAENISAPLEFGCGRGKEWYFHGEVAMIAMSTKIISGTEQQKLMEKIFSTKVKDLKGSRGDFTLDFFSQPGSLQ